MWSWASWVKRAVKVALIAAACLASPASGHGFIVTPASRVTDATSAYTPTGVRGGGADVVYPKGYKFPNGRHGACGDDMTQPYPRMFEGGGAFYHLNGGFRITSYAQGSTITIKMYVSANHGGYWTFKLCPVPDSLADVSTTAENTIVTQQCFDATILQLVSPKGNGNAWFIDPGQTCPFTPTITAQLPAGVTCKRCVLQWHWVTANSCYPPGMPKPYVPCQNCPSCVDSSICEEFWNCADISIVPRGQPVPPPNALAQKNMIQMNGMVDMAMPDGKAGVVSGPAVGTIDGATQSAYFPDTPGAPGVPGVTSMPGTLGTPGTPGVIAGTTTGGGLSGIPVTAILVGLLGGTMVGIPLIKAASLPIAVIVGMMVSAIVGVAWQFIANMKKQSFMALMPRRRTRTKRRRKGRKGCKDREDREDPHDTLLQRYARLQGFQGSRGSRGSYGIVHEYSSA